MTETIAVGRREFLKSSAVLLGGLVIGFYLPASNRFARAQSLAPTVYPPNAFIRIAEDNTVTFLVNKSEMGQGVYTSLPMIIAEELEADWSLIRVEAAPVAPVYNHTAYGIQMTGGSTSVTSSWEQLRYVGAAAKSLLIQAAAAAWEVDPAGCYAEKSYVIHRSSGKRLPFGALAKGAAQLPMPKAVVLKDPKDFKLIGTSVKRIDTPEKVNGTALFGFDIRLAGLLTAVVARSPVFGGRLKHVDAEQAKAVPGVQTVVQIPSGVAVVATGFWAAKRGRDALKVEWEEGGAAALSTAAMRQKYAELVKKPGAVAHRQGQTPSEALEGAAKRIGAEYEVPYLAHAMMEPLNCVVDLRSDGCEIWTGTQFQTVDRNAAAAIAGLKPEQVELHTTLLGGGFGRRANPASDFVGEAVHVAKAVRRPVKVVWTREDDIRGGYYRPMWYDRLEAGIDTQGKPIAWHHTIAGQSIMKGTPFEQSFKESGIDPTSVEGAADLPYAIANVQVDLHSPDEPVTVQWWRSVGHSHTAFVVESFLDELAHLAGKDPYEYRRALLAGQPRHLAVLELAAEKAGWGKPLPAGRARGIAVHYSFKSYVAQVAEVSVENDKVRVQRVVCAVDCGRVVNPHGVRAQMEGGIVYGLSAALYGAITLKEGRVEQSNFHDYPVLRFAEMPVVEVYMVPSQEHPTGVGEPGTPPIAPAVCNALFALTGKRIRRLPINGQDLKTA
jgi:isoquinoline 1-oxidoreductase beta subunit